MYKCTFLLEKERDTLNVKKLKTDIYLTFFKLEICWSWKVKTELPYF